MLGIHVRFHYPVFRYSLDYIRRMTYVILMPWFLEHISTMGIASRKISGRWTRNQTESTYSSLRDCSKRNSRRGRELLAPYKSCNTTQYIVYFYKDFNG